MVVGHGFSKYKIYRHAKHDLLSTFKVNLFGAIHKKKIFMKVFGHIQDQTPIQSILIYTKNNRGVFPHLCLQIKEDLDLLDGTSVHWLHFHGPRSAGIEFRDQVTISPHAYMYLEE